MDDIQPESKVNDNASIDNAPIDTDAGGDGNPVDLSDSVKRLAGELFPSKDVKSDSEDDDNVEHKDELSAKSDASVEDGKKTEITDDEIEPVPSSWPEKMREHWAKTPKEVRDYWATREEQMNEGLRQYKEDAQYGKQIKDVVTPYLSTINAQGGDVARAIQALLNAHHKLSTSSPSEKAAMLDFLARQYGIDKSLTQADGDESAKDPNFIYIQDKIHRIEQLLNSQAAAVQAQEQQRIINEVNSFASENPYFDDVVDDMVPFIRAGASLKEAYDKAVWANQVTRAKEQARVQQDLQAETKRKAQEAADAARKAASANIRSRDTRRTLTEEPRGTMKSLDKVMQRVAEKLEAQSSH